MTMTQWEQRVGNRILSVTERNPLGDCFKPGANLSFGPDLAVGLGRMAEWYSSASGYGNARVFLHHESFSIWKAMRWSQLPSMSAQATVVLGWNE